MENILNNGEVFTPETIAGKCLPIQGPGKLTYEVSFAQDGADAPLEIAISGKAADGTMQDFLMLKTKQNNTSVQAYVFGDKDDEDPTEVLPISFLPELADAASADSFEPWKPSTKVINHFDDEYRFLSNFADAPVCYEGLLYRNSEAAFQAAKCVSMTEKKAFCTFAPNEAKKLGRHVNLRPDWEDVKVSVMYDIVQAKFTQNEELGRKLVETGSAVLIEGNHWHDNYWGSCSCPKCITHVGKNMLGKILMKVRGELSSLEDEV